MVFQWRQLRKLSSLAGKNRHTTRPPRRAARLRLEALEDRITPAPALSASFAGINFDTDATNSGFYHIPPDPHGAAGPNHVVSVVNTSIQWYTKAGTLQNNQRLGKNSTTATGSFFAPLNPVNGLFDPKVIYDQYNGRFVVVALEKDDTAVTSRILLAVSDDSDPNGTWFYQAINGKLVIGGADCWSDYPGFATGQDAIYVTANMFRFSDDAGVGSRLWIVSKTGLYSGGAAAVTPQDPGTVTGLGQLPTQQPTQMFGTAPGSTGTFLVGAGWSDGTNEYLNVIRVDNPLTSPTYSNQFINLGNIDSGSPFPDAPQLGTTTRIATNDSRALNAVWRNNQLYTCNTINPASGVDAGQATAHWYRMDTTTLSSLSLADQGNVGGEDLGTGTSTFFPSVMADSAGNMALLFSASNGSMFAGAYYTGRLASDPAGTMQASGTLFAGQDFYIRTFGGPENRWGDYSGISLDPSNNSTFWLFHQYAMTRGTVFGGEDGRWATRWGSFGFNVAPTLTATGTALAYTENAGAVAIDTGLLVSDPDDTNLEGATVSITGYVNGQDVLGFTNQNGISGSFNAGTGVLTLTGTSSVANYQTALRSVTYTNSSDNPNTSTRTISFVANDGSVNSNTATRNITITAVNDAPTLNVIPDPAAIAEDSSVQTVNLSGIGAGGGESQTLTVTATSNNPGLIPNPTVTYTSPNATGSLTYTPVANAFGTAIITVTVTDSGGTANGGVNTFIRTFTVVVTEVNDPPAGGNDALSSVAEDSGLRTIPFASLLANDSKGPANESGQALTITAVSSPTGGSVSLSGTDVLFTPSADFNGAASFSYTLQDNGTTNGSPDPKTSTATVSFTVTEVNDAPTGVNDSLSSVAEDSGTRTISFASLLGNDSKGPANESGQTLTITAVSSPVGGTVSISGTDVLFTPTADFNGAASFTYTLQDNGTTNGSPDPKTGTASVSFTVTEVNDLPTGVNDGLTSVAEDSGVRTIPFAALLANDSKGPADESGQTLTITAVSSPVGGTVSLSGTDVLFTPPADFNGAASFTYTLQDNGTSNGAADPKTSTATVSFTVTEVNDAPTGVNDSLSSVAEDSGTRTISFASLLGNDSKGPANESGQTLTISSVSGAVGGSVSLSGTDVLFTLSADFNGAASFTYTLQDDGTTNGSPDAKTATATVSFTVTEVNDPPTGVNDALAGVAEDSGVRTISFASLLGNDSKGPANEAGQTLTITAVGSAVGGSVAISGTDVLFTPAADFNGAASFSYTLQDDGTTNGAADPKTSTATVSFTITEVNDPPTGVNDALASVAEDSGVRTIPFTSLLGNDSKGPANESGQALTITAVSSATGGTVSLSGTDVLFTPTADFNGAASFTYTLQDNGTTNGAADPKTGTATVSFTVTEVNDAPTGVNDALSSVAEDSGTRTISFASLLGNDAKGPADESGQTLTITAVGTAVGGTVSISGTDVLFTPTADFNGAASFTYTLQDNGTTNGVADSKTSTATVSFTITEVNDAPTGVNDALSSVAEDSGTRTIPFTALLANDSMGPANESGQALTITAVGTAVGGTVSISGTDVLFTPTADFNGTASFSYTLQDNGTTNGAADPKTGTASASFTVTEVNDAPTGVNDALSSVAEDSGVRTVPFAALLGNDSKGPANEAGQTLTISAVSGAVGGSVAISGTDVLFTPTADFNGAASFTYTLQDNGTTNGAADPKTGTATVSFTVTEVNDAPTGVNDALSSVAEDTATRTISFASLLGNDVKGPADEASQTLTIISVSGAVGGTVTISGTDVLFTPAAEFNGAASFSYTLQDNGTTNGSSDPKTATATVSFTITEVNDAPTGVNDALSSVAEDSGTRTISFASLLANDVKGPANESGQTLTITGVGSAVGGSVSISGTDVLFTPAADFNGAASFSYTLQDNGTTNGVADPKTGTASASFTVTEVNDAPTGVNDALSSVAEDSGVRTVPFAALLGNDAKGPADESGQALTITAVGSPVGGTVSISGTDVLFTPSADFNGTASFSYTLQDNGTTNGSSDPKTATATASFTVTEVNDAPTGVNDALSSVAEDSGTRTIPFASLLGNDSQGPANESGQSLTVTSVGSAVGGTVSISGTDVLFTPAANFNGPAAFSYTVRDNGTTNGADDFLTSAATVTFTVTEVNDPPIGVNDSLSSIAEDSGTRTISFASLLSNDLKGPPDEAGQALTTISVGSAVGGSVSISGTDVLFTPMADFNGAASFTYTLQDNGTTAGAADPKTATATVSFTVTEVNDTPAGANDTLASVPENSGVRTIPFAALLGNDSRGPANESGQSLTITSVGSAVGGTVSISGTDVLFTPALDFVGTASFTYTLQDDGTTNGVGDPRQSTATVSFTVSGENAPPVGGNDTLADIAEDAGTHTIPFAALLANDSPGPGEAGQTLTIIGVGGAVGGAVTISGTDVLFTPAADFNGPASFTYILQDDGTTNGSPDPKTATATVSFTVTEVNDDPAGVNDGLTSVAEDSGTRTIPFAALLGNDGTGPANENAQALTIIGVSSAVGGSVSILGTDVLFAPTADFNGTASFSYTLQDNGTTDGSPDPKTGTATVGFTITEMNDAPAGANDSLSSIAEDSGARTIPFAALLGNDSTGPVNESGQTLTIISVGSAVGGTVTISGEEVVFTPAADFNGPAGFTYTLQDDGTTAGGGDPKTATATVSFTVTEVNDAPDAVNDVLSSIAEDSGTRTIPLADLLANDSPGPANEAGQTLTIIGVGGFVGGTAVISGADVLFTPAADFFGTGGFAYSVRDDGQTNGVNNFKTDVAFATFTITAVNDPPVGTNDVLSSIAEDSGTRTVAVSTLLANDSPGPANESGQTLTITGVGGAVGGTVSLSGQNVLFTPAANFVGTAGFAYTVRDNGISDSKSDTAIVTFTVTAVNDPPDAVSDVLSAVAEDSGTRTIPVAALLANDVAGPANEAGQTLTVIGVTAAAGGTVSLSGTDVLFTPAANFVGTAVFTYTIRDNGLTNGASDPKTDTVVVSFTVTEVNDAPVANNEVLASIPANSGVRTIAFTALLANDSPGPANESSQTLTIIGVGGAIGGTVTISGTSVLFTPTPGYVGTGGFAYTVRDNGTTNGANDFKTDVAIVTFTITAAPSPSQPGATAVTAPVTAAIAGGAVPASGSSTTSAVTVKAAGGAGSADALDLVALLSLLPDGPGTGTDRDGEGPTGAQLDDFFAYDPRGHAGLCV